MTKIMIEVDPDWIIDLVREELKKCYLDQVKCWKHEKDFEKLSDSLLTVIEHYSIQSEYNDWYETIKEL